MPRDARSRPHRLRLAKLTPPTLPVVLKRPRLFRLLDKARRRPLTWITAPAGSGKTTLVMSYLKARHLPVCWYRLDETDADPSSFFHFLSAGAKSLAPRFRKPLPVLTPEYAFGLPTFTRRFFQELCARLPRRCVLVLDNYQDVPSASVLHQLLAYAIQEIPEHLSVIVMSRQDPPTAMAHLQAERAMTHVGPEPLHLSKAEVKAIIHLHLQRRTDRSMKTFVDEVYRRVGGWAAGLMLTLEQVKSREKLIPEQVGETPEAVFQYLAGEVMERLDPDVQELLLKTSVLSDISVPMAERLSNLAQAGDVLASLHAARYFTERREGAEPWYRYHPLFREFLRQRARQVLGPSEFRTLQRHAAQLLVAGGRVEDGVLLLQAAEDWEGLTPVILAQAEALVSAGRIQTLEGWIRSIPESIRHQIPWLNFWLATTRVSFSPDEAYGLFDDTLAQFRAQGERTGALLTWCGAVRAVLIRWTGLGRITKLLELFPTIHPEGAPYPSVEVEAHVADCMAGAIMQAQPYRHDARTWLDRAVSLSDHLPPAVQTGSRYMTEIYYLWFGDFAPARAGLEQFSGLTQLRQWNPITTIFFHATSATFAWFDSEFDLCRMHVEKARDLVNRSGLHVWDGLIISQGVAGELLAGNLPAAEALLREEDAVTQHLGGIHRAHFLHLFAWFKLLRGDFHEAFEHIQHSIDLIAAEGGHMFGEGINMLLGAHSLRQLGRQAEAVQWVERAMQIGDRMQSDLLRFGAWVMTAQLAFDHGDETLGLNALRKGLMIGETRGLMQYPGRQPDVMAALCAKALNAGIQVPFVQRMIQKHRFPAPQGAWGIDAWPWRVRIRLLGKLAVEIDGQPLEKHRKAPHRLLDLLAAIVSFGGENVPVARLTDALWPEADGDAAQETFKKSLARLRHLLGIDEVIQLHKGCVSLNRERCWVDALAFEAGVKEAERRTRFDDGAVDGDQVQALYKGPFLALETIPVWANPYREELRRRFVRLTLRRVEQALAKRQTETAVRGLEQALEVDPLAEPLYQRLIPLLAANGRQTDAASWYHRCKSALARWDARQPSFETQQLLKTLQLS
jgi:ATP/maltotriose-dependent transcriptional regulator MalT/DNA-binding SARP family transcriptional activator